VQSTRNNTILTLIDPSGKTRGWTSSGCLGFKNTRKSTTYAAQAAAESLAGKALAFGFLVIKVKVKGVGYGKQSSVRALQKSGLRVVSVEETTPIPYNGCRLPKKRRT
jgi:small subunit ribosomal protein S11